MKAREHAKVWKLASEALGKTGETLPENYRPFTLALHGFCHTVALAYEVAADEEEELHGC